MKARKRRRGQSPKPRKVGGSWKIWYREDVAEDEGPPRYRQTSRTLGRVAEMTFVEACQASREIVQPLNALTTGVEFRRRTVGDFIDRWQSAIAPVLRTATRGSYTWVGGKLKAEWGGRPLAHIERSDVQLFLTKAGQTYSPGTVHLLRRVTAALFSLAVEWGWRADNPAAGRRFHLPRPSRTRKLVVLTPQSLYTLISALPPRESLMVAFGGLLGLRRGEIGGLQWGDCAENTLTIRRIVYAAHVDLGAKSLASEATMTLGPFVLLLLANWKTVAKFTGPKDFLFSGTAGRPLNFSSHFPAHIRPTAEALGLGPLSWHDLRHSFCTIGRQAGVSPEAMQKLMRHASITTTLGVYSHIADGPSIEDLVIRSCYQSCITPAVS